MNFHTAVLNTALPLVLFMQVNLILRPESMSVEPWGEGSKRTLYATK